jgi:hypothetical protein
MTAWVLQAVGLLVTTIGALIVFLHLHRTSKALEGRDLPPECAALARDRRLLMIVMGLMAGWFLIQYIGLLLL